MLVSKVTDYKLNYWGSVPGRVFIVIFQVLMAVSTTMSAFWDVAPIVLYSLVEVD
jgi:hypothetical protein